MKKCVLIYSGGMDSFTLLNDLIHKGWQVSALSFNYGQRHSKELNYAIKACQLLGVNHKEVDITSVGEVMQGSSLTSDVDVPEGHYEESSMKATVVPNRNMIMLSIAIAHAVSVGADTVYIGAHAGDHAIYPDCRPDFIALMNNVAQVANYDPISILSPYLYRTKGEIAQVGKKLNLDYGLAWTCYSGKDIHCGRCGACQERLEAIEFSGATDNTEYADIEYWRTCKNEIPQ